MGDADIGKVLQSYMACRMPIIVTARGLLRRRVCVPIRDINALAETIEKTDGIKLRAYEIKGRLYKERFFNKENKRF